MSGEEQEGAMLGRHCLPWARRRRGAIRTPEVKAA